MDKIAFLALTYCDFEKDSLMQRFFNESDKDLYNLYIHNKDQIVNSYFERFTILSDKIVETCWGKYSLVEATVNLMEEALKDSSNKKFVLISGSHIPTLNMKDMHKMIFKNFSKTSFTLQSESKNQSRNRFFSMIDGDKLNKKIVPLDPDCSDFMSQWFICNREDARKFVKYEPAFNEFFDKENYSLADESYFALIANTFNIKWKNKRSCYFDWGKQTEPDFLAKGCNLQPYTFSTVSNELIKECRSDNLIFIRKVHRDTIIDEDFILSDYKEMSKMPDTEELKQICEYGHDEQFFMLSRICSEIYMARNISQNEQIIIDNLNKIDKLFSLEEKEYE